ncbi:hypothetical protein EAG_03964 [Camponotus floridanus]|uniref:Uncharacterized protein n=1 Tax=Camponotus floridanus TaxID=104421 RepID=E2A3R7_CAMFO|nr:hypothetical protein EAG_03964 [Camponotus floridanus]
MLFSHNTPATIRRYGEEDEAEDWTCISGLSRPDRKRYRYTHPPPHVERSKLVKIPARSRATIFLENFQSEKRNVRRIRVPFFLACLENSRLLVTPIVRNRPCWEREFRDGRKRWQKDGRGKKRSRNYTVAGLDYTVTLASSMERTLEDREGRRGGAEGGYKVALQARALLSIKSYGVQKTTAQLCVFCSEKKADST